jgi:hypothetical protein
MERVPIVALGTWRLAIGSLNIGPFRLRARSYFEPIRPGARRLGAGAPLTVLRFAPLARLRPVLGFHALNCV